MLENLIKEKGYSLGFCQVGFTHAEPFFKYKEHLRYIKRQNKYPPFVTDELEPRSNPKVILENCKTIISVAMSYKEAMKLAMENPPNSQQGYITPSAWGLDYHVLVKKAMDELTEFIGEKTDNQFDFKAFVDTGHLSDREVAKRAGIGYVGKNSALITKCSGSYVWLGHILTNLQLKNDEELKNLCGDCEICIKSCPTQAINSDGTIDYDKCLANVLIQKDDIPEAIIRKMGQRIYGCDTCQVVCPKNKEVLEAVQSTNKELGWLSLDDLEKISNREFKSKYGKSAFSWRGKKVLLRNIKAIKDFRE